MNRISRLIILSCIGVVMTVGSLPILAADLVSTVWMVQVDIGKAKAFEAALTKHMAFRQKANDPRVWQTYQPVTGNRLNMYGIRACCFDWAAEDDYGRWSAESGAGDHWNRYVEKFVSGYEHYYARIHTEDSHWPQELNPAMVGVTSFYVTPGGSPALYANMKKMSAIAKEGSWPRHWSWSSNIGGKPMLQLVAPYDNYAAMETPEEGFIAFLARSLGSEDEAMKIWQGFASGYEKSSFTVFRYVPDLSMVDNKLIAGK